jgi:hypothetical protein
MAEVQDSQPECVPAYVKGLCPKFYVVMLQASMQSFVFPLPTSAYAAE